MTRNENQVALKMLEARKKVWKIVKMTVPVLALAVTVLVIALIIDLAGSVKKIVLEAGDKLPLASEISGKSDAEYEYDADIIDISVPGEYDIFIVSGGKRTKVKLEVQDTTAPKAELLSRDINLGGPYPAAIDFFGRIEDASEVSAKFSTTVELSECGTYDVSIVLSDAYKNKRTFKTTVNVIVDKTPPVISGPAQIKGYVGEAIAYRKDVTITDNCFGDIDIKINTDGVNTAKEGTYKVTFEATDAAGNKATREFDVVIYKEQISKEKLMAKIESIVNAEKSLSTAKTREEQVKAIYGYVCDPAESKDNARIKFNDRSNVPERDDWVREAWFTLDYVPRQGDCYSFFSVSKAFFEYFGIENKDIQRSPGGTSTHFWCAVNIGTTQSPKWYYYDSTRLGGTFTVGGNNSCLFTEQQLKSYTPSESSGMSVGEFYPHGDIGVNIETKIINTNYSWK